MMRTTLAPLKACTPTSTGRSALQPGASSVCSNSSVQVQPVQFSGVATQTLEQSLNAVFLRYGRKMQTVMKTALLELINTLDALLKEVNQVLGKHLEQGLTEMKSNLDRPLK